MNSVFTIVYVFILLAYMIYSHYMVAKNFKDIEKKHIANKLKLFIEGSNHGSFHGAMFNVYFMYRRLLTVLILVLLEKLPSIQITLLTIFAVANFIYTVVELPYEENNIGEILNETAILLCAYMINTFMNCLDSNFSENLGWVFISICGLNIFINLIMICVKIVMTLI
jgi:hypothetical protein